MDQKNLLTKALGLLQVQRQHRWWLRIVTGMAAVVVFVTTYLLILPAITMEHSTLEVTATPSEAVLGETIDTEIYAEAEDGREETFLLYLPMAIMPVWMKASLVLMRMALPLLKM